MANISKALLVAAIVLTGAVSAFAADVRGPQTGGQCIGDFRSGIVDSSNSIGVMNATVSEYFNEALDVSERKSTIYSSSQLHTWSNEAKVSCAKAIGYFKSNEVNVEQITQCDCFYWRMRMVIDRRW